MVKHKKRKKIPITAIQGFLGSGKTTLLNYILTHNDGLKIGVVVNDFGDINIDSKLITSQTDKALELSSGCICCSLQTLELQEAIDQFSYGDIDYIIIEASGLAEPRDLALTLRHTNSLTTQLDSIITIIDAHNLHSNADNASLARDQLLFSDFVVINKVDLVSKATISDIHKMIRSFNPRARILESTHGQVNIKLLLDQKLASTGSVKKDHNHTHHKHLHESYQSYNWCSANPLDPLQFQKFVNQKITTNIYRAKGVLDFGQKGQDRKYIFHLVGVRPEIVWENWHGVTPKSEIVFIGTNIDTKTLEAHLKACVDPSPDSPLPPGIELRLPKKAN